MMGLFLLALLAFRPDSATAQHNHQAIAAARAAVRDMARIAVTPEEKALAEQDRRYVERAAGLVARREAEESAHAEAAGKQVQASQMSFNMQYLQLQTQMQNENRSYTAVSNIMKTKHDTVKNSINNVR